jgi:hypothetical protein
VTVAYDVPFLSDDARHVGPANLEWSHRLLGARRAAIEEPSAWKSGRGQAVFGLVPGDFGSNGPHRLVLQTKVRTSGLSGSWEIELPHVPFNFEFDPLLRLESILTLPDASRDESMARAIRLEPVAGSSDQPANHLALGPDWVLRTPPRLAVITPLPCDLAHAVSIELEGVPGSLPAGRLIASGQGPALPGAASSRGIARFDLGPVRELAPGVIDRPGMRRLRVRLTADPELGWADPLVRSVWPGQLETNWVEVEIMRA